MHQVASLARVLSRPRKVLDSVRASNAVNQARAQSNSGNSFGGFGASAGFAPSAGSTDPATKVFDSGPQAGVGAPPPTGPPPNLAAEQYAALRHMLPTTQDPGTPVPRPDELQVGVRLRVEWSSGWWPARVKEESGDKVKIGFDTYGEQHDEWIPRNSDRLRMGLPGDEGGHRQLKELMPQETVGFTTTPPKQSAFISKPYNPEKEFQKRQLRMKEKIAAMQIQTFGEADPSLYMPGTGTGPPLSQTNHQQVDSIKEPAAADAGAPMPPPPGAPPPLTPPQGFAPQQQEPVQPVFGGGFQQAPAAAPQQPTQQGSFGSALPSAPASQAPPSASPSSAAQAVEEAWASGPPPPATPELAVAPAASPFAAAAAAATPEAAPAAPFTASEAKPTVAAAATTVEGKEPKKKKKRGGKKERAKREAAAQRAAERAAAEQAPAGAVSEPASKAESAATVAAASAASAAAATAAVTAAAATVAATPAAMAAAAGATPAATTPAAKTAAMQTTDPAASTAAATNNTGTPAAATTAAPATAPPVQSSKVRWEECITDNQERYYHELATGHTQWEMPIEGWVELLADDGAKYYWDPTTNATQWEAP